jgi:hypothetical protein
MLTPGAAHAAPAVKFNRAAIAACAAEGWPTAAAPPTRIGTGLDMRVIELLTLQAIRNRTPEEHGLPICNRPGAA